MKRALFLLALAANAALLAFWLTRASTNNYLWAPVTPDIAQRVKASCQAIFWAGYLASAVSLNLALAAALVFAHGRRRWTLVSGLALAAVGSCCLGQRWASRFMAPNYLTIFEEQSVAESHLINPITDAGTAIAPRLMKKVEAPGYPRRRYAIAGLGKLRYAPAVSVLRRILANPEDAWFVRGDAYEALVAIDTMDARKGVEEFWREVDPDRDSQLLSYLKAIGVSNRATIKSKRPAPPPGGSHDST